MCELEKQVPVDQQTHPALILLAAPGPLQPNPVQKHVRMISLDWAISPSVDVGVDLLVQLAHRARANPRAPQGFGDVFHAAAPTNG
jgi:hypothetical protein